MMDDNAKPNSYFVSSDTVQYGFSYMIVLSGHGPVAYIPHGEPMETARLFAAADDMLKALQKTATTMLEAHGIPTDRTTDDGYIYDTMGSAMAGAYFECRDAIAKATNPPHGA